jgi:hypothetical protein
MRASASHQPIRYSKVLTVVCGLQSGSKTTVRFSHRRILFLPATNSGTRQNDLNDPAFPDSCSTFGPGRRAFSGINHPAGAWKPAVKQAAGFGISNSCCTIASANRL